MLWCPVSGLAQAKCWGRTWHPGSTRCRLVLIRVWDTLPRGPRCPEGARVARSRTHRERGSGLGAQGRGPGRREAGQSVRGAGRGQMGRGTAPSAGPGPGHVPAPLPRQGSAPGCGLRCGCGSHAAAQFSGSSPRPRDSPLSGPVQRPEIGRKRGLKIALITEGPQGGGGRRLLSGSWALPQPARDPARALGKGPHPGPPVPSPQPASQRDRG